MLSCFGPVLNHFLDEIQGNVVFEETTNNMQDSMAALDDLHGERRRSMEASVATKVAQADADAEAQVRTSPMPRSRALPLTALLT
jgi:hypothetical protein